MSCESTSRIDGRRGEVNAQKKLECFVGQLFVLIRNAPTFRRNDSGRDHEEREDL
jgi:hypothetical protein